MPASVGSVACVLQTRVARAYAQEFRLLGSCLRRRLCFARLVPPRHRWISNSRREPYGSQLSLRERQPSPPFTVGALLFLPVNWSINTELWLRISAALMFISLALIVFYIRASARPISAALLFTLCAALPVFPILLIGSDLAGARVLYLPSVGISLLWTQIFAAGAGRKAIVGALGVSVLLFQLTALLHNELIWKHEATIAHQACFDTAVLLTKYPGSKAYAAGLPKIRHGVYSLANGFPQCVAAASGGQVDPSRANVGGTAGARGFVLQWDDAAGRLVRPK